MLPVMSLEVLVAERPLRNNISFAIQVFTNCSCVAFFILCIKAMFKSTGGDFR